MGGGLQEHPAGGPERGVKLQPQVENTGRTRLIRADARQEVSWCRGSRTNEGHVEVKPAAPEAEKGRFRLLSWRLTDAFQVLGRLWTDSSRTSQRLQDAAGPGPGKDPEAPAEGQGRSLVCPQPDQADNLSFGSKEPSSSFCCL